MLHLNQQSEELKTKPTPLDSDLIVTEMKKFVVFDEDGGWAAQVEAESLERALVFICEDREEDFSWRPGDSIKIGEIVFDGKIQVDATDETRAVAANEKLEALSIGTLLAAQVDSPVCIMSMRRGDVGMVVSGGNYRIKLLQGNNVGKTYWYGNKNDSIETFNERWKIIYTPPE